MALMFVHFVYLFPAQAGVILMPAPPGLSKASFPRASGGDPIYGGTKYAHHAFSPRKRG